MSAIMPVEVAELARAGRYPYSPAGITSQALRRHQARIAGYASGRARRARSTCLREPRPRTGQEALALRYNIRQVGRDEFERLYRAMCEREDLPFDTRGLRTCHELYRQQMTAYRVQGQDWETTNAQIGLGLAKRGRARCRRTIQRQRQRLVAMGLIGYSHVRRSGALRTPGNMDTLRVRCLCPRANVTPPSGAGASPFGALLAPASPATTKALIAPPLAADGVGRRCAAPGTERNRGAAMDESRPAAEASYATEDERRYAFLAMCEEHAPALLGSSHLAELARLRSRLASGHDTARTDSIAAEGER